MIPREVDTEIRRLFFAEQRRPGGKHPHRPPDRRRFKFPQVYMIADKPSLSRFPRRSARLRFP